MLVDQASSGSRLERSNVFCSFVFFSLTFALPYIAFVMICVHLKIVVVSHGKLL